MEGEGRNALREDLVETPSATAAAASGSTAQVRRSAQTTFAAGVAARRNVVFLGEETGFDPAAAIARTREIAAGEEAIYCHGFNEDPMYQEWAARALADGCKVKLTASTFQILHIPNHSPPKRYQQVIEKLKARLK